ncbi:MAG: MFS transporter [Actinomycetota bacterium]
MTAASTPSSSPPAGEIALDSGAGRTVIAATVAGSAVAMLTATVVNVALPVLADDLGANSGQQQWVVNAYLLALASLILIGGNLGDRYGRVRMYQIGVAWFAGASLLCALAPSIEWLIAGRLLQGIGGALLTPGSLAIIESTLRPDDRGRGVGQWSGLGGIAGAIGPLIGGLLVDLSWRWVFLVNLPVAAVVLLLSVRVPESSDPEAHDAALDLGGAILTATTLGGASYVLIEGGSGGFGALDWVALVVAVVSLVGLIWYERRQEHPIVPFELFANRPFAAANLVTVLVYGGMGVVFFLLSIQLQVSLGWSPLASGAALLPVTVMMLVLSSRFGAAAQKVGPRWPLTVGPLLIAGGMLWFSGVGPGDGYLTAVLPGVLIFGFGLAVSVAPVTSTALGTVPAERAGAASGVNNAVARTGQLLAVAAIPPLVGLGGDALGDPVQLTDGFGTAMYVGAALVAFGGLASAVLFESGPLRGPTGAEGEAADGAGLGVVDDVDSRFHCAVESPGAVGSASR